MRTQFAAGLSLVVSLTIAVSASAQGTVQCPPWTDNPIVSGQTPIRAQHINELRACLDLVMDALSRSGPLPPPAGSSCTNNLGTVAASVTRDGSWDGSCSSVHFSNGRFARYYSFTLNQQTSVTIDLTSPSVDTYLVLRNGAGTGTGEVQADDDGGTGQNARITRTVPAGTYTIEATTFQPGSTGPFTLMLSVSGGGGRAPDGGRAGVATTVPALTYNGNQLNDRIGIVNVETGLQQGQQISIEVSVRDHACEDGDIVEIQVEGVSGWNTIFNGEIFNQAQVRTFDATVGYHYRIIAIAINGTGFKGNCSHADVNTGEMTVRYGNVQANALWEAPGGSGSAGVINVMP